MKWPRTIVLLVLITATAAFEAFRLFSFTSLTNNDLWSHLATGVWIIHNHALPQSGLFSQLSNSPWIASSWLWDLKLGLTYRIFGLRAIPILSTFFKAALAVIAFLLASRCGAGILCDAHAPSREDSGSQSFARFWLAILLSAIAQYVLAGFQPSPTYCSILFFGIELLLLSAIRETGNPRLLYGLPPLFLVWANVDPQFVYGLAALLIFSADFYRRRSRSSAGPVSATPLVSANALAAAVGLSFLATLITPYFYRPWGVFLGTVTSPAASKYLPDFKAMSFHQPQDYLLMLLTMAAFLALGMRRSRDVFAIVLLAACAAASFHAQRDIWLVALAALAVIGEGHGFSRADQVQKKDGALAPEVPAHSNTSKHDARSQPLPQSAAYCKPATGYWVLVLAIVALCAAILLIRKSSDALLARVGETYPVAASNYIRDHHLPQPLFNAYEWGGFLTWYLPEYPVAIDSRYDLYGDDYLTQYSKMMNAEVRYTDWPPSNDARTMLLPKSSNMGQAFSKVSAFRVVYSDEVAIVLERQQ